MHRTTPTKPLSSRLGHRLYARLSRHTTEWQHVGTVERVENVWGDGDLAILRVALKDGGLAFLRLIDGAHCIPSLAGHNLLRIDEALVESSPYFKTEPTDHFLDMPMGPSVGEFHDRQTQVIDFPQ